MSNNNSLNALNEVYAEMARLREKFAAAESKKTAIKESIFWSMARKLAWEIADNRQPTFVALWGDVSKMSDEDKWRQRILLEKGEDCSSFRIKLGGGGFARCDATGLYLLFSSWDSALTAISRFALTADIQDVAALGSRVEESAKAAVNRADIACWVNRMVREHAEPFTLWPPPDSASGLVLAWKDEQAVGVALRKEDGTWYYGPGESGTVKPDRWSWVGPAIPAPILDHGHVHVWPFANAPGELRALSPHGGGEKWIALAPVAADLRDISWLDEVSSARQSVSYHKLDANWIVFIAAYR